MIRCVAWLLMLIACSMLPPRANATANAVIPPTPSHYVTDQSGLLGSGTVHDLEQKLEGFERQTSNQVLVVIYPHLPDGQDLAQYCTTTFQAWGVGQKGKDNGVVLFIFSQDHKLFISTGYGLEGSLPDATCHTIISKEIVPRFKQGFYAEGVTAGVNAILAATQGEYHGTGRTTNDSKTDDQNNLALLIVISFILIIFVSNIMRGGNNSYSIRSSGGNWSGGGWNSGGGGYGGGGFSGGGGGTGGGGAGGSW